ncbi:MAG: nucleotide exchange factor GrpE [Deltaproteobacteria bacterium]|nr:nucleotide exchange factor GrpE [Deltaproteobacteria bacterium]
MEVPVKEARDQVEKNEKAESESVLGTKTSEQGGGEVHEKNLPTAEAKVISELEAKMNDLQTLNSSLQEQMLRVRAEAENFRKRVQREKDEFALFAREGFIRELLPVKDNLERALSLSHSATDAQAIIEGVRLTLEQFESVLKNMGVECVECLGQAFDPAFHEAMTQVESDKHEPNMVVDELQKGYQLHGRLLRPALVSVARNKGG